MAEANESGLLDEGRCYGSIQALGSGTPPYELACEVAMSWHEFPWQQSEADPVRERLCADRPGADSIDCRVEGSSFLVAAPEPKDELVVVAYNVERGLRLDQQLEAFASGGDIPAPDILLLSEADRGCSRTQGRNVAREYAEALGMCYVYAVEFVELPRIWGPGGGALRDPCEHGNAIISRYPLGNVRLLRHERSRSWNSTTQRLLRVGQPRLGGRVAVAADVRIDDRIVRIYSVHFESGRRRSGRQNRDAYREAQAREVVEDARTFDGAVLVGGDMNVVDYLALLRGEVGGEPVTRAFEEAGYRDAHSDLPPAQRATSDSGVLIDLIFARGLRVDDARVGATDVWDELSDHLPTWARFGL